ncbi:GDSL esterase/lipase At5g45670-like [Camellia sinensis]|uniref:GDSL esterase/lipase At5g45670-like n=1 Tax=Camellia sinensis TaxID=4442 RepID=UPI00103699F3|nr:GDSL esterase/lipase At5g45670-like [Camellia sinensis]
MSLIPLVANLQHSVHATPEVPCLFIFGDSLADNGNNNYLATAAKANYQPYGIDFSDGPTGRFCNGRTMSDIIGQRLGFDHFIPPFATARGRDILMGVNYASGGGGIRDETGMQLVIIFLLLYTLLCVRESNLTIQKRKLCLVKKTTLLCAPDNTLVRIHLYV